MEITSIRISKIKSENSIVKAVVSVVFDTCFVVNNIKIIDGIRGLFIGMPSRKSRIECQMCKAKIDSGSIYCSECGKSVPIKAGEYDSRKDDRDIAHPITNDFREHVSQRILEEYNNDVSAYKKS